MWKASYRITPKILKDLTKATELKVWIERSTVQVSWLAGLQYETMTRLAHSSTAIEGNSLSLAEVQKISKQKKSASKKIADLEVHNYLEVLKWIGKEKRRSKMTESKLLSLHKRLLLGILPKSLCGVYKKKPNRVIDGRGKVVYVPPPPRNCPKLTRDLLAWIQEPEVCSLHPVLLSGIVHHRLLSIHPFRDGNGRLARALGIWISYTGGFDTRHLLAVDEFYYADRALYYKKIQQARELDDDLTYWLEYVVEGVLKTLEKTQQRIQRLKIQSKKIKVKLSLKQESVLSFIRDQGQVQTGDIEKKFKITRARVNQLLKPLVEAEVILREGQTRATSYFLP